MTGFPDLTRRERIARMYAPQVTPARLDGFTTDAESDAQVPARDQRSFPLLPGGSRAR